MARYTAAHATLEAVQDALQHPNQVATLHSAGVTADSLTDTIRLLRPLAEPVPLPAGLTDRQIEAALSKRCKPAATDAMRLLRAVAAEFDQPRPGLHGVTLPDRYGDVAVCRLRRLHGVAAAAVLALDGTGNIDQVRRVFGAMTEHVEVRVDRDAHVVSPIGKTYSRQSITGATRKGVAIPSKATSAPRLRNDVATIAARLPGPVLLVAAEQAKAALIEHLPLDTPTAHYGAVRGSNGWEQCRSVITAGPAPIGLEDVENLARCYLAADQAPFVSSVGTAWPTCHSYQDRGWPFWCTRGRRMRDGSVQPVEVAVHPDPRVQAMLEQIREAEVIQAIDRTRAVWHRREVVALDSLVLDLTYDRCPSHRDLVAGGSRVERAWAAEGVIPLGSADLHKAHPDLFCSPSAARESLKERGGGLQ